MAVRLVVHGGGLGPVLVPGVAFGRLEAFLPVVTAWSGLVLRAQVEHRTAVMSVSAVLVPARSGRSDGTAMMPS